MTASDLQTTHPPLPAQWTQSSTYAADVAINNTWWRSLGSEELNTLIQRTLEHGNDVAAAIARVRQAEAIARQAGAASHVQLTGSLDGQRQARLSGDTQVSGNRFGAGFSASYEADFWGRNRAVSNAALSQWQASRFDHDTVKLTLAARVADAWLQAQALQERQLIAQRNLANAERLLRWLASRARAGAASALELAQQRGLVAAQRRNIAALEQQRSAALGALSALVGEPTVVMGTDMQWHALHEPSIAAGLPSGLLMRRPDIATAEARLSAANANVAAARAAMLPSLTLSAGISTGGKGLRSMFENPLYTLGANLAAPIFDGGRLRAGADLAQAQREELLANYRQTIFAAFSDADVVLQSIDQLQAQSSAQAEVLAQAQRALVLAERRYAAGAETLLTLLDVQRNLYAAQDESVQLRQQRLQARVALFRALGGGWTSSS